MDYLERKTMIDKLLAWQTPQRQVLIDLTDKEPISMKVVGWTLVISPIVVGLSWVFGIVAGLM